MSDSEITGLPELSDGWVWHVSRSDNDDFPYRVQQIKPIKRVTRPKRLFHKEITVNTWEHGPSKVFKDLTHYGIWLAANQVVEAEERGKNRIDYESKFLGSYPPNTIKENEND